MRKTIPLLFALVTVLASSAASADGERAEAISITAQKTAGELRHRWDKARTEQPTLAACLESKVMQAISVAKRAEEHRTVLRDLKEPKERARRIAAIDRLGQRRAEIVSEADGCEPGDFTAKAGTIVSSSVDGNIAAFDPVVPEQVGTFPSTMVWALLRLR